MDFQRLKYYLISVFFFILIFFISIKEFIALDYLYDINLYSIKAFYANQISNLIYIPFQILLYPFIEYFFQIAILLAFLTSAPYLKKLTKYPILSYILFYFNPFIYSRIMVGQLGIILSYLLTPIYIYYLIQLFKNNFQKQDIIKTALTFTLSGIFSIHFLLINGIIFAVAIFYFNLQKNNYKIKPKLIRSSIIIGILVLLLNAYWLQGFLTKDNILQDINEQHKDFFAPKLTQDIPTVVKVIGMWGFWREASYITTFKTLPLTLWYFLTYMFFGLMLIGYFTTQEKKESKFFFTLWWVGLILAVGASHPYTKVIFDFLFNYIPLFNGLRDSHKLVALIAISYTYLCPIGIMYLKDKIVAQMKNQKFINITKYLVPTIFIALIILYTYPLIGLSNQIKPTTYPQSYQETNNYLKQQNITGHIIYLPWLDYMTYNWTLGSTPDGRIANPINKVIEPVVITNPGPWGTQTEDIANITKCININNITCLENNNVQYILYDKCFTGIDSFHKPLIENLSIDNQQTCIDTYEIQNKQEIDRNIKLPIKLIVGLIISLTTLIIMLYFLIRK